MYVAFDLVIHVYTYHAFIPLCLQCVLQDKNKILNTLTV